jgi:hypothetical protein
MRASSLANVLPYVRSTTRRVSLSRKIDRRWLSIAVIAASYARIELPSLATPLANTRANNRPRPKPLSNAYFFWDFMPVRHI